MIGFKILRSRYTQALIKPPIQWVLGHSWGHTLGGGALTTYPHLVLRLKKE